MAGRASCNTEVVTIQLTYQATGLEAGTYAGAVVVASYECGSLQVIFIVTVEPLRHWLPLVNR